MKRLIQLEPHYKLEKGELWIDPDAIIVVHKKNNGDCTNVMVWTTWYEVTNSIQDVLDKITGTLDGGDSSN
tara:strand:+ start:579 stop:791 length:213 start_codon:yes stop_codon:yes gene_type:complete